MCVKGIEMKNPKTIAVDFDGALSFGRCLMLANQIQNLLFFKKNWSKEGNKLILWTCRIGQTLEIAVKWCE